MQSIFLLLGKNKDAIICGIRFATAGLIAFLFYQYFDLQFGYWAVVSVAAVMQPYLKMTNKKALLRLLGTLIGVVIGYLSALIIIHFPSLLISVFFVAMFLSACLIFFNRKYSYMGVVCGITAIIIITTYNQYPSLLYNVAIDRTIDVIVGILISWFCSAWIFPEPIEAYSEQRITLLHNNHLSAVFKLSLVMALSTTIALMPWFDWHYFGGFWAPISCLFIVEENVDKTQEKSGKRFLAHVIVVLIAVSFSFLMRSPWEVGLALVSGLFLFGYWMLKPPGKFDISMANTMAIAYSIVLLISPGETNTIISAFSRFLNTIIGIGVGLLVVKIMQRSAMSAQIKS